MGPEAAGHWHPEGGAPLEMPAGALAEAVGRALDEDLAEAGDPTGAALEGFQSRAALVARQPGTLAGLGAAGAVMGAVASRLGSGPVRTRTLSADGEAVAAGATLAVVEGAAPTLLAGERTTLNLIGHLSGVATRTADFVKAVAGTGAAVRDTRKTLPGLRALEKYAVRCGGGCNHRMGLHDGLLVKDNHIRTAGSLTRAVELARSRAPHLPLEVEVETLEELEEALRAGCELLLLDNMDPATMGAAVARAAGRARTEASGGITLETVAEVAATGVDFVSVGAITHSAPALDVAFDWVG